MILLKIEDVKFVKINKFYDIHKFEKEFNMNNYTGNPLY